VPLELVKGFALAGATALAIVLVRFLLALARGEEADDAARITGRWTLGIIGAAGAVGALGLMELADVMGMLTMFVGSHPLAFSNGLVTALGAFVAGGWLELSARAFLGVAIALVGITMLIYEVGD